MITFKKKKQEITPVEDLSEKLLTDPLTKDIRSVKKYGGLIKSSINYIKSKRLRKKTINQTNFKNNYGNTENF